MNSPLLPRYRSILRGGVLAASAIVLTLAHLCPGPLTLPLSTSSTPSAYAADKPDDSAVMMRIDPSVQTLALIPGQTTTGSIRVYAVNKEEFDFETDVAPYSVNANNEPDFTLENDFTRLVNWITIKDGDRHASKNNPAVIDFEISVPEGIAGGGQYAAILIRPINKDDTSSGNVSIVTQIASIINGHVIGDDARYEGTMTSHSLPAFILGDFTLSSTFQNTGNVDLRAIAALTVYDFFTGQELVNPESLNRNGGLMGTVDTIIFPGTTATLEQYWENSPQLGLFRVTQTINFMDHTESYEKLIFVCPIWLLALVGAFVALFVLWLILHLIDRKRERPQVF